MKIIFPGFVNSVFLIIILKIIKCVCSNFIVDNITLKINQGTLFGKKSLDYGNESFYSFKGIPYAKPPIGALRFKAPIPAESWSGVYDATQIRPICPQPVNGEDLVQSENCLFLNIHTKMTTELRPVMVYIHGGGLEKGSIFDKSLGPEFFMMEDIVLVKIAYRLNIFGFLSFEDPKFDIPGNAGFKDQVMALKWLQQNIHHFGGDPNQVTIFGHSAGGAAVHLLYLSPLAKGLFHRAIVQSGAADAPYLTSPNRYPELATVLKCDSRSLDDIVDCINGTSTNGLLKALQVIQTSNEFLKRLRTGELVTFNCITIENANNSNSFLIDQPENIVKNGKFNNVPIIMGFVTHEGELVRSVNPLRPNFTDNRFTIPRDVKIGLGTNEAVKMGNRIKEFYYGNQRPSVDLIVPYVDYLTDVVIMEKLYKFAKLQSAVAKKVPIYVYHFDLHTNLNALYNSNSIEKFVTHADDLRYLFFTKNQTPKYMDPKSDEYIGIHRMIKLWTTFATSKNADPNPENDALLNVKWLAANATNFNYLEISKGLELKQNPFEERMKFWESIYANVN